jgi:hypothetical protein
MKLQAVNPALRDIQAPDDARRSRNPAERRAIAEAAPRAAQR